MNVFRVLAIAFVVFAAFAPANADFIKRQTNSFAWFRDIHFVDSQRGWIVGTDGIILSTENGGQTWTVGKKFTADALLQVHFVSEDIGWMLCERNILQRKNDPTSYVRKTTDGGRTWEKIEFEGSGRERVTKLLFTPEGKAIAFGEGGYIYQLQEDQVTWKRSKTAMHYLMMDGGFADDRVGAIVGAGGTIMFTEDSGFTWEKASLIGDSSAKFNGVFFAGARGGWAVGTQGRIFRTNGGGRLWRQQNSGVTANLTDVYFTSPTNGWAVGEHGIIVETRNAGETWTVLNSNTTHRLEKVIFAAGHVWAIGYGGTLLASAKPGERPADMNRPDLKRRG